MSANTPDENPLDTLDPDSPTIVDDARAISERMLKEGQASGKKDFWDDAARSYLEGVILHVKTCPDIPDEKRTLDTVRKLAVFGEKALTKAGEPTDQSPHQLLFASMMLNKALDGKIEEHGSKHMAMMGSKEMFDALIETVSSAQL